MFSVCARARVCVKGAERTCNVRTSHARHARERPLRDSLSDGLLAQIGTKSAAAPAAHTTSIRRATARRVRFRGTVARKFHAEHSLRGQKPSGGSRQRERGERERATRERRERKRVLRPERHGTKDEFETDDLSLGGRERNGKRKGRKRAQRREQRDEKEGERTRKRDREREREERDEKEKIKRDREAGEERARSRKSAVSRSAARKGYLTFRAWK